MFFFLNTDDAYLLSSWSGSFSPVSRRQKRPCHGYVYMVIVTHKHDYVYVKGIFGKLTTNNYINTLCSSFFPWNLVCAISVPNGVASGIKSGELCLQFFKITNLKQKTGKQKIIKIQTVDLCESHQSGRLLHIFYGVVEVPSYFGLIWIYHDQR